MSLQQFLAYKEIKGHVFKVEMKKMPGNAGIIQTVDVMKKMREFYKKDPIIRTFVLKKLVRYKRINALEDIETVYHILKERLRYVSDIHGIETVQSPRYTWNVRAGDCDDFALIGAVFLETVGIPTKFKIVGKGNEFSHIYTLAQYRGNWYPFDLTASKFGVERKGYTLNKIL